MRLFDKCVSLPSLHKLPGVYGIVSGKLFIKDLVLHVF